MWVLETLRAGPIAFAVCRAAMFSAWKHEWMSLWHVMKELGLVCEHAQFPASRLMCLPEGMVATALRVQTVVVCPV
jgi:hypothetical protein